MKNIMVDEKRLKELERAMSKLNALEAGKVESWEWYDESLKDWRKDNEVDEIIEDTATQLLEALAECAYEPSECGAGFAIKDGESIIERALKEFKTKLDEAGEE